jgi:hypothetical protein
MTRLTVTIQNPYNTPLKCVDIPCAKFTNLFVGDTIEPAGQRTYSSDSNDRVFVTFQNSFGGSWQLAMTSPKSSSNSACGITPSSGLQPYEEHGTPVAFTYILGQGNLADWKNGDKNTGAVVTYGDC